jgi:pyruvate-formate lyase-activating enzyme
MVFDELCVLANGDIACSCGDPAGLRVYGNVLRDRIADVYAGARYRSIREWQLHAAPDSFCPVIGSRCGGRVSRATRFDEPAGRAVRLLQLEPISFCDLRCPQCPSTAMTHDPSYARNRQNLLPLKVMLDVLDQLPALGTLLFFNFGEPFLHPEAVPFLREARRRRPEVVLHASTNGVALKAGVIEALAAEALVDRMLFSVDGARPSSYERYRVGGDLRRALANLRAFRAAADRAGTRERVEILWQYILFEWNDSDEEIAEAHALASDLGVALKFVVTHTKGASKRFAYGSRELEELVPAGRSYDAMTCDSRMLELWRSDGVAAGRYDARLTCERTSISGAAGERVFVPIGIGNPTSVSWSDGDTSKLRIGMRVQSPTGARRRELQGIPIPPLARPAGGQDVAILDFELPAEPGGYHLVVDVVEDDVCWFSERGSTPLFVELCVTAGAPVPWDPSRTLEAVYGAFLRQPPDREGRSYWMSRLQTGLPVEHFIESFREVAGTDFALARHALVPLLQQTA